MTIRDNQHKNLDEWQKVNIDETIEINQLLGPMNAYLEAIKKHTNTEIIIRGDYIFIKGDDCEIAKKLLQECEKILKKGHELDGHKVDYIINLMSDGEKYSETSLDKELICFNAKGKPIKPMTKGQKDYVNTIRNKDVVFGIGPAGTGKTYIAIAMAVTAYKKKQVEKIILTRPAVEAGEKLGFLPGDMQEKVDPYLRPLYDALYDVLGRENTQKLREREIIEVVPLAYMRGRTLDNAFIILDEAQNTTKEQMKMFLTRMGFGSKIVVTGDVTQKDLPRGQKSGLVEAEKILKNVKSIGFCNLRGMDVVRHKIVKEIITAYDEYYRSRDEELE